MIDARLFLKRDGFHLDLHLASKAIITVLSGRAGAGKSLVLECLAGFARPDHGRILAGDELVFDSGARLDIPPERRRCVYIPGGDTLFPQMTLRENLNFAAAGRGRLERRREVDEMLEVFGLASCAGAKPGALDPAQRQRGSIARALLSRPKALLLDEPSRGMDAVLKRDLHKAVRQAASTGVAIVIAAREMSEAMDLAEELAVLQAGRILQQGSPAAILDAPSCAEVLSLLDCYNLAEAEIIGLDPAAGKSRLRCNFGGPPEFECDAPYFPGHLLGARLRLAVRIDAVHLDPGGSALSVRRHVALPHGRRIEFQNGLTASAPANAASRNAYNVRIDPSAWRLLK